jgi:hypothetical protein
LQLLIALHPEKDRTQLYLPQLHLVLQLLRFGQLAVEGIQCFIVTNQYQDVTVDVHCLGKGTSLVNHFFARFHKLAGFVLKLIQFGIVTCFQAWKHNRLSRIFG